MTIFHDKSCDINDEHWFYFAILEFTCFPTLFFFLFRYFESLFETKF